MHRSQTNSQYEYLFQGDEPSNKPSYRELVRIEFRYVYGFDEFQKITPLRLSEDKDGFQMSSKQTLYKILADDGITGNQRNSRMIILDDERTSIIFPSVSKVLCLSSLVESSSCVLYDVVLELSVDPLRYDDVTLTSSVRRYIKRSMETPLFLYTLQRPEVKEVMFIDSTYPMWNDTTVPDVPDSVRAFNTSITGIVMSASLLIALSLILLRSRVRDDRNQESSLQNIGDFDVYQSDNVSISQPGNGNFNVYQSDNGSISSVKAFPRNQHGQRIDTYSSLALQETVSVDSFNSIQWMYN